MFKDQLCCDIEDRGQINLWWTPNCFRDLYQQLTYRLEKACLQGYHLDEKLWYSKDAVFAFSLMIVKSVIHPVYLVLSFQI